MPNYDIYGYGPGTFYIYENGQVRLDPNFDASRDRWHYQIDDGGDGQEVNGDTDFDEVGDDNTQNVVVYDQNGNFVDSGQFYAEEYITLDDGAGNTINVYRLEINGDFIGHIADGPITPGVTYDVSGPYEVTDATKVPYSNLEQGHVEFDPDDANDVTGGAYGDQLRTGAQNDTVAAGRGNDTVEGGDGDDLIHGEGDNDVLLGDAGSDTVYGGSGDDFISGGVGNDSLYGDDGSDTFSISDTNNVDTIYGGEGGSDFDQILFSTSDSVQGVDVTFTGDEAGTYDFVGTNAAGEFYEIEGMTGTLYADSFDASASSSSQAFAGNEGRDTIIGGTGSDALQGGAADDTITGDAGDDTLLGGAGNDMIEGGDGADTVEGGTGDDNLKGGAGGDAISGGLGEDTLSGGDGDDYLQGDMGGSGPFGRFAYEYFELDGVSNPHNLSNVGFDADGEINRDPTAQGYTDQIDVAAIDASHGGNGDTFALKLTTKLNVDIGGTYTFNLTSDDGSRLYVDGSPVIDHDGQHVATTQSNTVSLGPGEHLIEVIYFDNIGGETLDVSLSGPDTFNETIALEDADISLAADDIVEGGEGNDTLDGGVGDDVLTGGGGNDTFIYRPGDGNDTISDFGFGNTGALENGDTSDNDYIDLSGYYDRLSELQADQADDGVLNQSNSIENEGGTVDYSDNTRFGDGSLRFHDASASSFSQDNTNVNPVCFADGTMIRTPGGDRAVETLGIGDAVMTADGTVETIRWAGMMRLEAGELADRESARPILIRAGSLGDGLPERDLVVSPQHRVLVRSRIAGRMFGAAEVLVPAKKLVAMPGIEVADWRGGVSYHHIMLSEHRLLVSNGAASESLLPGPEALRSVAAGLRVDLRGLIGEMGRGAPARPLATGSQSWRLAERHAANRKPLVAA